MSKTKEIANEMKTHFADFEDNHDKAVGEMKKLVTAYRKASVAGE